MAKRKKDVEVNWDSEMSVEEINAVLKEDGLENSIRFYINQRYVMKDIFALRALRTKYGDDFEDMYEDMPVLKQFHSTFVKFWKSLPPVKIGDVIQFSENTDTRRELFQFFPTRMMFQDAEVVHNTMRITEQVEQDGSTRTVENVYKLVRKKTADLLNLKHNERIDATREYIYAVKVECVTTGKTYFLMVDSRAEFCQPGKFNAAAAIAWTALCPITNPKGLIRQGEVMLFEKGPDSKILPFDKRKHLTEEEYFSLLKYQS